MEDDFPDVPEWGDQVTQFFLYLSYIVERGGGGDGGGRCKNWQMVAKLMNGHSWQCNGGGNIEELGRVQDKNSRGNQATVGVCEDAGRRFGHVRLHLLLPHQTHWAPYWGLRFPFWSNLCLLLQWFQRHQLYQYILQLGLSNHRGLNWGFSGYKVSHWRVSCCHREQDCHIFSYEICA